MGVGSAGGAVGVVTAAFFSAKSVLWSSSSADIPSFVEHHSIAAHGHLFTQWPLDEEGNEIQQCAFWNLTHHYAPNSCTPFAVSRVSPASVQTAIGRALKCASINPTTCILAPEIGFDVPGLFLYDEEHGFSPVLAPKILHTRRIDDDSASRLVRIKDLSEGEKDVFLHLNRSIDVEFLTPGSRTISTKTFTGNDAYCVQTLRWAVSPSCWQSLD